MDVTDATFEAEVVERSYQVPVVVDLWAPWCGPCVTLGPIIEKVVGETGGKVQLVKVDIDQNPAIANAFQVQSIPAVFAFKDGRQVNQFMGAVPEANVAAFVNGLLPTEAEARMSALIATGDEASLRAALELQSDHPEAVAGLAQLLATSDRGDEALALLARIPESTETRRIAAVARAGTDAVDDDVDAKLDALLLTVKGDDDARRQFLDLLELLGPEDPRTATYRRRLTTALY